MNSTHFHYLSLQALYDFTYYVWVWLRKNSKTLNLNYRYDNWLVYLINKLRFKPKVYLNHPDRVLTLGRVKHFWIEFQQTLIYMARSTYSNAIHDIKRVSFVLQYFFAEYMQHCIFIARITFISETNQIFFNLMISLIRIFGLFDFWEIPLILQDWVDCTCSFLLALIKPGKNIVVKIIVLCLLPSF